MTCVTLLGRDFFRHPSIKVELGETVNVIERYDSSNKINQFMRIKYLEMSVKMRNELNINPGVESEIVEKVKKLYEKEYVLKEGLNTKEPESEMKILLKNNQPIAF